MTTAVNQMNLNPNLYLANVNNASVANSTEDEQVFEFCAANEAGISEGPQDAPEEIGPVIAAIGIGVGSTILSHYGVKFLNWVTKQ